MEIMVVLVEIVVELQSKLMRKGVDILSYTIGLCNVQVEAQGVLSYSVVLSYSPRYYIHQ